MFRSKTRPVVTSQAEHARLSGTIAAFWGSQSVVGPPGGLPLDSFARGVLMHDRGYGPSDTMGIGEVDESTWLATQLRGIEMRSHDRIADTVALMHVRRLVSGRESEEARRVVKRADERIEENLTQIRSLRSHGVADLTRAAFERADTVTALCDMISFRVCFEEPTSYTQEVRSETGHVEIAVTVDDRSHVTLAPWPLSVPELSTVAVAYEASGYPDQREPVLKRVVVSR